MKNSLGTLAAVAALATPAALNAVISLSSVSNISLDQPGTYGVDIDGDGTNDVFLNADIERIASPLPNGIIASLDQASALNAGYIINASSSYDDNVGFDNFINADINYAGVSFQIDSQTHYAWLEFESEFESGYYRGAFLRSAAWETSPGVEIEAGAIPEPRYAALAGGALAIGASLLRRKSRKRSK